MSRIRLIHFVLLLIAVIETANPVIEYKAKNTFHVSESRNPAGAMAADNPTNISNPSMTGRPSQAIRTQFLASVLGLFGFDCMEG
jgi:hypothetical protein